MKDYLAQAAITAPKAIVGTIPSTLVLDNLKDIIREGNKLDLIKKSMFYGKDLEGYTPEHIRGWLPVPVSRLPALLLGLPSELAAVEVIHGVVGAITETVELAEALVTALESGIPIDVVNLAEECGDVLWYIACILRHSGKEFPDLMEQNIAKLRKRYPDGFTTYDALNRDLGGERVVLEATQAAPAAKPVVHVTQGSLMHYIEQGDNGEPAMRLHGFTKAGPGVAERDVLTSRVVKVDVATGTYETKNTVYIVDSWSAR